MVFVWTIGVGDCWIVSVTLICTSCESPCVLDRDRKTEIGGRSDRVLRGLRQLLVGGQARWRPS